MGKPLLTNELIDAASVKCGTDSALAAVMGTSKQVISDWRAGRKKPSPVATADLAAIAGYDAGRAVLMALIDDTTGPRRERLQNALRTAQSRVAAMQKSLLRHVSRVTRRRLAPAG